MAAAMVLLGWAFVQNQVSDFEERIMARESALVQIEKHALLIELTVHTSDAVLLANLTTLGWGQSAEPASSLQALVPVFWHFARERTVYHQVRFLNAEGREVIRVNRTESGIRVVPESELQSKKHRDYFQRTMKVPRDTVHISRFELNVEQGRVELPFRPVIRLASPVIGPGNQTVGIAVLNFMGARLLGRLRRASSASHGDFFMLNEQGYFLLGPGREHEWGFMLPGRKSRTMAALYPLAWPRIVREERGQFITPRGIFTFETIGLARENEKSGGGASRVDQSESWKIVTRVPLEAATPGWIPLFVRITAGLLLLLGAAMWLWAGNKVRREQAEGELRRSEARVRIISETVNDAVIMVDSSDQVQFWNPAAEKMFGYERQEIDGQPLHERLLPENQRDLARRGFEEFARTGQGTTVGRHFEFEALRKGGDLFPVEVGVASFNYDGQWYAVGTVRDLTRRKRDQEALSRSRESLAKAQEIARLGNWDLDLTRNRMSWSDEVFRIFGFQPGERPATYDTFLAAVHPDDRGMVGQALYQALESGRPYEMEYRVVAPDGAARHVHEQTEVVRDDSGNPVRMIGTIQDVSARKRTEDELKYRNLILATQQEMSPDGMLIVDFDNRIQNYNQRFMDLWGIPEKVLRTDDATPVLAFIKDRLDDPGPMNFPLVDGIEQAEAGEQSLEIRLLDGRTLECHTRALLDQDDTSWGRIWFFRDITQRKQMEEELRHLATTDPLTGVYNRRQFISLGEQEFRNARRYGRPLSFMMMDLDRFKNLNDSYGHAFGDRVLKEFCELCLGQLRDSDVLGRIGGEEFAVALASCDLALAETVAERIRLAVQKHEIRTETGTAVRFTVSLGVARLAANEDLAALMRRVDEALYEAKNTGRNRVVTAE